MNNWLLEMLVDPVSKTSLKVVPEKQDEKGMILKGALCGPEGKVYPIIDAIPRFGTGPDLGQQQTSDSFGFKWKQQLTYDSPSFRETASEWLIRRHGFGNQEEMLRYFSTRKYVLDAGCGSGFTSSLWLDALKGRWVGADISEAVDVARTQLGHLEGTGFVQADISQLPFKEASFDTILAEGVLHHTPSTERSLKYLAPLLKPSGEFLFYVYRKKSPAREFTDDYVRDMLSELPPEEAWDSLRPLTRLGEALHNLHATVVVPEDVPLLGIKAGSYDVQRFIYWHFAKLFWNEAFTFEENNHVNFDWYHPRYAHRHTEEEIRRWCIEAGLTITRFYGEESGYSVRAIKN